MKINIIYPHLGEFSVNGKYLGVFNENGNMGIPIEVSEDTTIPGGSLVPSGEILMGDPRGVYADDETKQCFYQPRAYLGMLPKWVVDWLDKNRDWPNRAGVYGYENESEPLYHSKYISGDITPQLAYAYRQGILEASKECFTEIINRAVWRLCDNKRAMMLINQWRHGVLANAEIVIWQGDMWNAAQRGSNVFEGITADASVQITRPQMWVWNGGMGFHTDTPKVAKLFNLDVPSRAEAIIITPARGVSTDTDSIIAGDPEFSGRRGMTVCLLFAPLTERGVKDSLPRLRFFPAIYNEDEITGFYASVVAAIEFMKLEIVALERKTLPSKTRRRIRREKATTPTILTVVLRKRQATARGPNESALEYSCQWLVKGHWRNQYYGKTDSHRPKFINPYLKGPEDKPFKVSPERIAVVKR